MNQDQGKPRPVAPGGSALGTTEGTMAGGGGTTSGGIRHMVLRASAGTGKTFALTGRYLTLLSLGVNPGTILATTFTRKAAGEILQRVMLRLARAAGDEQGAQALARELGVGPVNAEEYRKLLKAWCGQLHRCQITTIDGFFARVGAVYALELGLPVKPRMAALEDAVVLELRREAIAAMLSDEDLWVLVDLMRRLQHDSAKRSVTESLDEAVRELHEVYVEAESQAWHQLERAAGEIKLAQLIEAGNQLEACLSELEQRKGYGNVTRFLGGWLAKVRRMDWVEAGKNKVMELELVPGEEYAKKPLSKELVEAMKPLVHHTRAVLLNRVVERTEALHELMEKFERQFKCMLEQRGVMLFGDLTAKLASVLGQASGERDISDAEAVRLIGTTGQAEDWMDIYYRLDGQVGHLLLDEFQDTSLRQWAVLKPVAQEMVSHGAAQESGRSFFCVGDVKQSIYGWRGGCSEIFERVESDLHLGGQAVRTLNQSYRSSQVVLDAVNQVFGGLASTWLHEEPAGEAVLKLWQREYANHQAAKPRAGHVQLRTLVVPGQEQGEEQAVEVQSSEMTAAQQRELMLRQLLNQGMGSVAQWLADWLGQAGANWAGSVGVLMRRNESVQAMVKLLGLAGVEASGEGAGTLTEDPAVAVILAGLQLGDHPGDAVAAFHVYHSPLGQYLGMTSHTRAQAHRVSHGIRQQYARLGPAGLLEDWSRGIAGACDASSGRRLMQLMEIAESCDTQLGMRPAELIHVIEHTKVDEPSAARVRVMTVHQAKGLEFDLVVLGELDANMGRDQSAVMVRRAEPTGPIVGVYAAADEKTCEQRPQLSQAHQQRKQQRLKDDLSVLYVAMTRAKQGLVMFVKPTKWRQDGTPGSSQSAAGILKSTLSELTEQRETGGELLYERGQSNWFRTEAKTQAEVKMQREVKIKAEVKMHGEARTQAKVKTQGEVGGHGSSEDVQAAAGVATQDARAGRRKLMVSSPSGLASQGVRASEVLMLLERPVLTAGRVIHQWLAMTQWMDDEHGLPTWTQREAEARKIEPGLSEAKLRELEERWQKMMTLATVRQMLSLREAQRRLRGKLEVWRERAFAVVLGEQLIRGQFDRVLVAREGERAVQAEVLDYKTDRVPTQGVAALVKHYEPQMQSYRAAVAKMLKLQEREVMVRLLFLETGEVVEIE